MDKVTLLESIHGWPRVADTCTLDEESDFVYIGESVPPVYFMVGCQRSGSNWLRTILGEREDLIAPHPPHILREFMPILPKFGDFENGKDNLKILVDHVCSFVERNQVTWYDKHGRPITFNRQDITLKAVQTVKILRALQHVNGRLGGCFEVIDQRYYLLAIFDEIMNYCAHMNDKYTWMCKSMGMSKYHNLLINFYGPERLRYIYLVRDPRDVALSFTKTPVGDCHPYVIARKWAMLQDDALHIKRTYPELILEVRYEDLLHDKVNQVAKINEFIGTKRRIGRTMRRGSIIITKDERDMLNTSRHGHEALKASKLSSQFQNLTRGNSFIEGQFQKWRKEMDEDVIRLVELAAEEQMGYLGYKCHVVDENSMEDLSELDIDSFVNQNRILVQKMNEKLAVENFEDFQRRIHQAEVLDLEPVYMNESFKNQVWNGNVDEEEQEVDTWKKSEKNVDVFKLWPKDAHNVGFLNEEEINFHINECKELRMSNNQRLIFAAASQSGYYPHKQYTENQDTYIAGISARNLSHKNYDDNANEAMEDPVLFGVFDGHGRMGKECSNFVRDAIRKKFVDGSLDKNVEEALINACSDSSDLLTQSDTIDSTFSGTTAILLCIDGDTFHVSNVGDGRCIVASSCDDSNDSLQPDFVVKALCDEHTPEREDEMKRMKDHGSLVMTVEEHDGLDESIHSTGALRIWSPEEECNGFGCAFTRSIGDTAAKSLGVIDVPEYRTCKINKYEMFIMGSDGIFDFISNEEAVDIARQCSDPKEACRALVGTAYARWIKSEERADDITVIVGQFLP